MRMLRSVPGQAEHEASRMLLSLERSGVSFVGNRQEIYDRIREFAEMVIKLGGKEA
jgi:hypothetical protein